MNKMLSMVVGSALVLGLSAANAGEPMMLSAAQMDDVTAGCMTCQPYDFTFTKLVNTQEYATVLAVKEVVSLTYTSGNLADAEATADAIGPNSMAQTLTVTTTIAGVGSSSYSGSLSAN